MKMLHNLNNHGETECAFAEVLKKSKLTPLPFTLDLDLAQLGNGSDRKRQAGLAVASTYGITAV